MGDTMSPPAPRLTPTQHSIVSEMVRSDWRRHENVHHYYRIHHRMNLLVGMALWDYIHVLDAICIAALICAYALDRVNGCSRSGQRWTKDFQTREEQKLFGS